MPTILTPKTRLHHPKMTYQINLYLRGVPAQGSLGGTDSAL